jgi:hypothetical protein
MPDLGMYCPRWPTHRNRPDDPSILKHRGIQDLPTCADLACHAHYVVGHWIILELNGIDPQARRVVKSARLRSAYIDRAVRGAALYKCGAGSTLAGTTI